MRRIEFKVPGALRSGRTWFAETLVVLGILAFAWFAATIEMSSSPWAPTLGLERLF